MWGITANIQKVVQVSFQPRSSEYGFIFLFATPHHFLVFLNELLNILKGTTMSFLSKGFNRLTHWENSLKILQSNLSMLLQIIINVPCLWLLDSCGTSGMYWCYFGLGVLLNPNIYASYSYRKISAIISFNGSGFPQSQDSLAYR